jgi:peptidoglycan hydrolase-like protein with peptidoglycan-binding domain
MSVEAMSGLPFQAGSAVAAAAGRTALWVISRYMQQPLRNTALAALIGLSAMAGSNALYHQSHHHPAPLFGTFSNAPPVKAKKTTAPVMPAARPKKLDVETTGSVDPALATPRLIGNAEVTAVQRQLAALNLFDGKADGLFGPWTSKAIRAFETKAGRAPKGQLTEEIVALIKSTPVTALPEQVPAPTESAPVQVASTGPAVAPLALVEATPLPAPAPLLSRTPAAAAIDTQVTEPAAAEDTQVAELAPADDTSAAGIETLPMTKPGTNVLKRTVPTIAVRALAPAPAAATEQAMPAELDATADVPPATDGLDASNDPKIVAAIQRGLNSLGFLHAEADGVAGETTAKAIRNFEVYFNYNVTGRVTKGLVNLLVQSGAVI